MADKVNVFQSGSSVTLTIGGKVYAYITNLSFSDDVAHAPVGGIGSYGYDAIEPTSYAVRGSFSVHHYEKRAYDQIGDNKPARSNGVTSSSFLNKNHFSPADMLLAKTFDIHVYPRAGGATAIYSIIDCKLTSYSLTFTPGQLLIENIGFLALKVNDNQDSSQNV